jgi:hypothetical protein
VKLVVELGSVPVIELASADKETLRVDVDGDLVLFVRIEDTDSGPQICLYDRSGQGLYGKHLTARAAGG